MKRYQILGMALLVLAGMGPPAYAGRDDWRSGRNGDRNDRWGNRDRDGDRHRRCRRWGCDEPTFSSDYYPNNWNYLNAPPWYRLNYYTPWMSDYRDGTAWSKIPTSHAAEMYGMPSSFNTMPSGYYAWLAANGNGNGCGGVNTGYPGNAPQGFPPQGMNPQGPVTINPGTYPGGNDVVQPTSPIGPGMDIVVVVQRELRKRGFYQGMITGVSDPSTRAAIRAYEARAGLPTTGGVIGIDLLRSLGLM